MFGFFKPKSYLGIDVGSGGIKLVELRQEKNRPVLFSYGLTMDKQDIHKIQLKIDKSIPHLLQEEKVAAPQTSDQFGEDKIEKYAHTIKSLCKTARIVAKSAVVSLPVSSVFHAAVTLPLVKKEELDHLVKAEVKKLLPMPLEEMALDFQVLKNTAGEKNQRVIVNAVPYKLIEFYSKVFARTGLTLEALEPESTALTRCLMGRDQAVAMIVDIGSERTNFFIIDQGFPITHQSIESGGDKIDKILQNIIGMDADLVEQIKYDLFDFLPSSRNTILTEQKWLDMLMPVFDPILKEIEVSLEVYLRQTGNEGKRPEKIILTGGMSLAPFLAKYIESKFKLKCYVGDSWARVVYQDGLKPVLRTIGPRMSVSIGLALRSMV
jgi:type IV pilus assembly protein PilM